MSDTRLQCLIDGKNLHETALMAATHWAVSVESKSGLNLGITPEKFGQAVAEVYIAAAKQLIEDSRYEGAS
jgi:hypothetical protein